MSGTALAGPWGALRGDASALDGLEIRAPQPILRSPLPVGELAIACAGSALLAAAELAHARGVPRPSVILDPAHVEASFTSERHLRLDGCSFGAGFAPLSTWLRTADGWLRSHANYPHHRAALVGALGVGDDLEAVRAAASRRGAEELEEAIFAAGGCAGALRDEAAWEAHPAGQALAGRALVELQDGRPGAAALAPLRPGQPPATGVRVLDLTRVIAGPVGTRTLAALGAEVLRIDAPGAFEPEQQVLDTGSGKRSALLDLRTPSDAGQFHQLLADADVLVEGYRPGALDALGFGANALAAQYPNLVTVTLSAWGDAGPWGTRRGFDSLVQSATGIAAACTTPGAATPGALPAQALDHGTGHLIAAAALRGLTERTVTGRPLHARLALAATAVWLLDLPRSDHPATSAAGANPDRFLGELRSPFGAVGVISPPGELDGRPLRWTRGAVRIGSSRPSWQLV